MDTNSIKIKLDVLMQAKEQGKSIKVLEEKKEILELSMSLTSIVSCFIRSLGYDQEYFKEKGWTLDQVVADRTKRLGELEWDESTIKMFQKYINKE